MSAHWGGPVKFIDTSRATQRIVLSKWEKKAIIDHLNGNISEKDLDLLFEFLAIREIVDIGFEE